MGVNWSASLPRAVADIYIDAQHAWSGTPMVDDTVSAEPRGARVASRFISQFTVLDYAPGALTTGALRTDGLPHILLRYDTMFSSSRRARFPRLAAAIAATLALDRASARCRMKGLEIAAAGF